MELGDGLTVPFISLEEGAIDVALGRDDPEVGTLVAEGATEVADGLADAFPVDVDGAIDKRLGLTVVLPLVAVGTPEAVAGAFVIEGAIEAKVGLAVVLPFTVGAADTTVGLEVALTLNATVGATDITVGCNEMKEGGPLVTVGAIEEIVGREVMFPFVIVGAIEVTEGLAVALPFVTVGA